MSLLVLSAPDVDAIVSTLSPEDLQLLMAKVFFRLSNPLWNTSISMPPRIVFPTANHTALFMPARIGPPSLTKLGDTAIKVVCVPKNADPRGLPGTTLVLDEATGGIRAVVNARKLTALRNAAASLLSTSLVGPSNPLTVVSFGAGQQIDAHLDLHIRHFPSISQCTIVNRTLNDRTRSLGDKLTTRFPHVKATVTIREAVQKADIVICATSSTLPLFPSSWVKTGTHVILIGSYKPSMREVDRALVLRSLSHQDEKGDLNMEAYRRLLSIARNPPTVIDDYEGPITLFKSVGIGLQDVAIAGAVVDKALSLGKKIGTQIEDYDT
ncbi:hypothetical protein CPB84DRAFT_1813635 [Gymnopilus junonius]|uniref:NAD(P)-binding protein n=1 Tax=Gymnopilus junonius TaxID=109634 RepID=A0A9P5NVS2_GYMJU|nr:hypothetical protein CPB84DRAFT_1813635 [Gymnopilus junonius]